LTDNEAYNLIFAPGFSTKEEISDISGRGVGMDVVKTKITQLNGTVNIESEKGKGTILEIKVPLTLAILPTLMVVVGKQTFALPLAGVNEIFNLNLNKTNVVDGQLTIIVRDKAIPLFYLEKWLLKASTKEARSSQGHVVIVQLGTQQIGFVVDALIGQEEVVIKPLDAMLQGTPGMAGATITSDGGIALILDVPSLLKHYTGKARNKN
jgi:two-component system chemotaxis sensor kinase CheA